MQVSYNENLADHTTFRIGGIAENYYVPESVEELSALVKTLQDYKILSAGSNLLINDRATFEHVIYMGKVCTQIDNLGSGRYRCGASVRIQKLISTVNADGYGGIEELVSIPAMIGGMIYMNASIGRDVVTLSDYVTAVEVLQDGQRKWMTVEECCFSHRSSVFQQGGYIIIGAEFRFPEQDPALSKQKKEARIKAAKEKLDFSGYNFGSLYKECDYKLMSRIARLKVKKGGISLSAKTTNWLNNDGSGCFDDACWIIRLCNAAHRLFRKKAILEICIWDQ